MENKPKLLEEIDFLNGEYSQLNIKSLSFDEELTSLEVTKVDSITLTSQLDEFWEEINTLKINDSILEIFRSPSPTTIILDSSNFYTLWIDQKINELLK